MSNLSLYDLELYPDPNTPDCLLPAHLRCGDNSREERCRKVALRLALGQLSEKQREALHMRYTLGLSFRMLAAELGVSRSAAETRVKRAQDTLRTLIEHAVLVQREMGRKDG